MFRKSFSIVFSLRLLRIDLDGHGDILPFVQTLGGRGAEISNEISPPEYRLVRVEIVISG